MKPRFIKLTSIIVIAAFVWQNLAIASDVAGATAAPAPQWLTNRRAGQGSVLRPRAKAVRPKKPLPVWTLPVCTLPVWKSVESGNLRPRAKGEQDAEPLPETRAHILLRGTATAAWKIKRAVMAVTGGNGHGEVIVEIGARHGTVSRALAWEHPFAQIYAVDPRLEPGVARYPTITPVRQKFEKWDPADLRGKVDRIYFFFPEAIKEPKEFASAIERLLMPGTGEFVLVTELPDLSESVARALEEAGFVAKPKPVGVYEARRLVPSVRSALWYYGLLYLQSYEEPGSVKVTVLTARKPTARMTIDKVLGISAAPGLPSYRTVKVAQESVLRPRAKAEKGTGLGSPPEPSPSTSTTVTPPAASAGATGQPLVVGDGVMQSPSRMLSRRDLFRQGLALLGLGEAVSRGRQINLSEEDVLNQVTADKGKRDEMRALAKTFEEARDTGRLPLELLGIDTHWDDHPLQQEVVTKGAGSGNFEFADGLLYHGTSDLDRILLANETRGESFFTRLPYEWAIGGFTKESRSPAIIVIDTDYFNSLMKNGDAELINFVYEKGDKGSLSPHKVKTYLSAFPKAHSFSLDRVKEIWVSEEVFERYRRIANAVLASDLPEEDRPLMVVQERLREFFRSGKIRAVQGLRHTSLSCSTPSERIESYIAAYKSVGGYFKDRNLLVHIPFFRIVGEPDPFKAIDKNGFASSALVSRRSMSDKISEIKRDFNGIRTELEWRVNWDKRITWITILLVLPLAVIALFDCLWAIWKNRNKASSRNTFGTPRESVNGDGSQAEPEAVPINLRAIEAQV